MNKKSYLFSFIVAFGGFVFGLDAAIISGTVNFISVEFGLSDLQIGTVVSAPGFGVIFALLATGFFVDKYGRKSTLLIIAFLYLVSAILSASAPNFTFLVAARFLGGLAFTSLSIAAMYIGEIAPAHLRGKLVAMNQVNTVVGLSAAYFINYFILSATQNSDSFIAPYITNENAWRWMLGSEILPALVWFLLLFLVPPSPRWLVMKGRDEEAYQTLKLLYPLAEADKSIIELKQSNDSTDQTLGFFQKLSLLFNTNSKKVLWLALAVSIIQPITGINAILFYAPTVFEQSGVGTDAAFTQAAYIGIVSLIFTFLAFILIDKVGRRPLTILGLVWASLSLGICTYGFHKATYSFTENAINNLSEQHPAYDFKSLEGKLYESDVVFKAEMKTIFGQESYRKLESDLLSQSANLPATLILVGILMFIAAFQLSIGPVLWVILSEIFPTHLRGVAIPAFAFVVSLVSYLVQQFFPWQLTQMGAENIFMFYAVVTTIGAAVLIKILPETKNKTIEEIANSFK
ncbi:MFS transporter [Arcticibacterium luteifluviistationis]|uniref:MFS transporter n=1 Tax=Arcticibacterium luteifluviistationis TaxID=1784714 RepID=A0A2Z4G6F4_9BACT|nr:MFS transporter [Arcticibacterium luteifluviistationis]AWV96738.1 MFS transporter [Arcticibacterium luteifluviistationis]